MIKTRIAPSPTGELHVGHLRTCLYAYAWAKKNHGEFIIRIEDTDRNRFVPSAAERGIELFKELGINSDQKIEYQSQRLGIYKKYLDHIIVENHAYYCFCSPERLQSLKDECQKKGIPATKYDKKCLHLEKSEINKKLANNENYVVRLKIPENETISFYDEVLGKIEFDSNTLDDQILLKSDGFPTYVLAATIDDRLMEINWIFRGHDWISTTPKQIVLYKAFGWEIPKFAHLPNLKEKNSTKKLSKRLGAVYAIEFLKAGYLPQALMNFMMLLGWAPKNNQEIFSLDEFTSAFSIKNIGKTDLVVFDREKLIWLNGLYIRNLGSKELVDCVMNWVKKYEISLGVDISDEVYFGKVLDLIKERLKFLGEIPDLITYFYHTPTIDTGLIQKYTQDSNLSKKILTDFVNEFSDISDQNWNKLNLDKIGHDLLIKTGYKPKEAFMTLRIAITGREVSPPIFDVLEVLGKNTVLERLEKSI